MHVLNRALAFTKKTFRGILPAVQLSDEDKEFVATVTHEVKEYIDSLEALK